LPQLVRRLVLATTRDVVLAHFRSGEGVLYSGWDGLVESAAGSPFVPAGTSVWEMGTNHNPRDKAEDDYRKRTADPLGLNTADTTFVFVTPRRWPNKADWVAEKMAKGTWREVRAYDADDLETFLEPAPTVHSWISALVGKDPVATQDLETYWTDWADGTDPATSCDLVVGGRDEEVQRLIEQVEASPSAVAIRADSRDEALAFLAASIQRLPEVNRDSLFARAIVVHDPGMWRRIIVSDQPLLLVPLFEGAELARAIKSGHTVVIPVGKEGIVSAGAIDLPRPRRAAMKEALLGMGLPDDRAEALATLGRRSLLALRRTLASSPAGQQPMWARPAEARAVLPAMLAGAWVGDHTADRDALAVLAARPYEQVEQDVTRLAQTSDPPVRQVGATWLLASKEDAWARLHPYLTGSDLQRLEDVARDVLGRDDVGGRDAHSGILREGIADTLALMAIERGALAGEATGQDRASRVIRTILARANADDTGLLWASLSGVLPLLAEAAPDVFIEAVDAGLKGSDPVLLRLFGDADRRDLLFAGSPHSGLLWALENLAWNPDFLGRVALILARLSCLTSLPPQIGNRPDRSLRAILLPWLPQTAAPLDRRLAVLDALRDREPSVAWDLLVGLLPRPHDSSHPTHGPRWREWQMDREPGVTVPDWYRTIRELTSRALEDVGTDGHRWHGLIDATANLPPDAQDEVIDRLLADDPAALGEDAQAEMRGALRSVIAHHRRFQDAEWAMPAEQVDRLAEAYRRLEPDGEIERREWLFADRVDLPDAGTRGKAWDYRGAIDEARDRAVREIHRYGGLHAVRDLAAAVERPADVGWALGRAGVLGPMERDILTDLASPDVARRLLARGYVGGRFRAGGWDWAASVLEDEAGSWSPAQRGEFLVCLDPSASTFDWAERLGDETERAYWSHFGWLGLASPDDAARAAAKLITYGRPHAAVDLLGLRVDQVAADPDLVVRALERAAEATPGDGIDWSTLTHDVAVLLDYIAASGVVDEARIARLEWIYLPLLHDRRPAGLLHRELARDPAFFAEVVSLVFRAEGENPGETTKEVAAWATYGYYLLKSWRWVPGRRDDGGLDAAALASWMREARRLLAAGGRSAIGDQMIGQVLGHSQPAADGAWPDVPVRDLIEEVGSDDMDLGLHTEVINSRGVTSRGLTDGGAQERSLVERYNAYAQAMSDRWPRTAALLRRIAQYYDDFGRREDARAELTEDTWR